MSTFSKDMSETIRPVETLKPNNMEPPWVGGTKVVFITGSHDQDGRHAHIW